MDMRTHLLSNAKFIASPNCDNRPENTVIDLLVIHNISLPPRQFGGTEVIELFCNQLDPKAHPFFQQIANLKVSSHLFIRRTGEVIQFVPFHQRAWHAGISYFQGRSGCNDFSIGIELEGADDIAYEAVQYQQLIDIVKLLLKHYPKISLDHIVGHSDIAPMRKTDPGLAFDWAFFRKGLLKRIE